MINLRSRAWRATISASLLFIEGLVVLGLALYLLIQSFVANNISDHKALIGEIIYVALASTTFFLFSWGFYTNRRFARAPAILTNLIFLGISTYMFAEHLYLLGATTFVISAATAIAAISVFPE